MPRKVKVVNINEDSTYGDVAEAIVENEVAENQETPEETKTQTVEPEPPKPKARAKRVAISNRKHHRNSREIGRPSPATETW